MGRQIKIQRGKYPPHFACTTGNHFIQALQNLQQLVVGRGNVYRLQGNGFANALMIIRLTCGGRHERPL